MDTNTGGDTDPFGAYSDSSSTVTYCWPQRKNFGFRFSAWEEDVCTEAQSGCTSTNLNNCACQM